MTGRLIGIADDNWARFDGQAALRGVDPMDLPIDRFLSMIYAWVVENMEEEELEKFETRLWMPPKGVVPEQGPWSPEAETAAFGALQAQVG